MESKKLSLAQQNIFCLKQKFCLNLLNIPSTERFWSKHPSNLLNQRNPSLTL